MQVRSGRGWFALSIVLLGMSCSDPGRAPEVSELGSELIQDAVHNAGKKGFYWLPPIASVPKPTGVFDPTLSPVVEIVELNARNQLVRTVATLNAQTGRGAGRLHVAGRSYRVKWSTAG